MKVLFLDIDGVLNSHEWFRKGNRHDRNLGEIDPEAAARVQRLCDETGAKIVVSSTWRLLHKRTALCDMFRARGITAQVVGMTPAPARNYRGDEIQAWLDDNAERLEVDGMAIVDDDSDMLHLTPWLVRTPFETGITDAHVLDLRCVMAQPMPPIGGESKP